MKLDRETTNFLSKSAGSASYYCRFGSVYLLYRQLSHNLATPLRRFFRVVIF